MNTIRTRRPLREWTRLEPKGKKRMDAVKPKGRRRMDAVKPKGKEANERNQTRGAGSEWTQLDPEEQ
jgi:hypothetical protein